MDSNNSMFNSLPPPHCKLSFSLYQKDKFEIQVNLARYEEEEEDPLIVLVEAVRPTFQRLINKLSAFSLRQTVLSVLSHSTQKINLKSKLI